ncbi:MAG TPA: SURF1 family protein [Rudaea sp.]|jgi:cytochrome oxidase assembly protein ShyY1
MRHWQRASGLAIALMLIGVALFVRLGIWQLDRAREAQSMLDAFAAAPQSTLEDFTAVAVNPPAARFPHVRVHGHYIAARTWFRDEQMRSGRLGVEAYGAFAVDGVAATLLVDRGWVAWEHAPGTQPPLPAPAADEIELTGIYAPFPGNGLRLGGSSLRRQPAGPKLTLAIDHDEIAVDLGTSLLPRVLLLDADPASGFERTRTPALMPPARHQAYAFQWFAFAVAAVVIFVLRHWIKVDKQARGK